MKHTAKKLQAHLDQLRAKAKARGIAVPGSLGDQWEYVPLGDPENNVGYWKRGDRVSWDLSDGQEGTRPVYSVGIIPLVGRGGFIGDRVIRFVPYVPSEEEFSACLALAPPKLPPFPEVWKLGRWGALLQRSRHLDSEKAALFQFEIPEEGSYFESMMYYETLPKTERLTVDELTDFAEIKGLTVKRATPWGGVVATIEVHPNGSGEHILGPEPEKADKIEIELKGDESTPPEAPCEAEPAEYVEYELEPSVEVVLDEPEEDHARELLEDEPDDHSDGRYGDQQRYADPDEEPKPELPLSVTRDGERGWDSWF